MPTILPSESNAPAEIPPTFWLIIRMLAGTCDPSPTNEGLSCDDGLFCTDNDVCGSGICAGSDNCPGGQVCGPTGVCIVQTTFVFQDDGATYTGTEDAFIREAAPGTTHGTPADTCGSGGPVPCDFFEWDAGDPPRIRTPA